MSDTNSFTMIGLHKLAAERGDGLIPELLALYSAREKLAEALPVVVEETSMKSTSNDNVIPIRPYLLARKKR